MIWLLLVFLLICSGAVSASETALFALNRRSLQDFRRSPVLMRRRVGVLMAQPRGVLMTVLLANTAVNVSIFAISFVVLRNLRSTHPALAAAGGVCVLLAVILLGEMVPKSIALSGAQRLAPPAAVLIDVLRIVLAPLRFFLRTFLVDPLIRLMAPTSRPGEVTTDELRQLVDHSAQDGVINLQENTMLQAAVTLRDIRVREIMTPRVDIESICMDGSRAATLGALRSSHRRKLPVHGRNLDDIRGILYTRDLLTHTNTPVASLWRPVYYVPEQINLLQLIQVLRVKNIQLAIAVDEFGGTAGLVTMEDIVETIVGDLPDPNATRPTPVAERIDRNAYRVSGDLSVREWADRFGVREVDHRVNTVGGLVLAKIGRLPRVGDTIRIRNLSLTVEKMDRHRIESVILRRGDEGSNAGGGSR
ncbi:MAG: HlyC/CorC family transporter [Planctomycetes bacterium]|nr:HlyC/CorC family transporter [Planctomycetota bacterium]